MNEGKMHACMQFLHQLGAKEMVFPPSRTWCGPFMHCCPFLHQPRTILTTCMEPCFHLHPPSTATQLPNRNVQPLSFSQFKDLVACTNGFFSVLSILITQVPTRFRNFKVSDSPCFVVKGDKSVNLLASLCNILKV